MGRIELCLPCFEIVDRVLGLIGLCEQIALPRPYLLCEVFKVALWLLLLWVVVLQIDLLNVDGLGLAANVDALAFSALIGEARGVFRVLSVEVGKQLDSSLVSQELWRLALLLLILDRAHILKNITIDLDLVHFHIQIDHWLVDYCPTTASVHTCGWARLYDSALPLGAVDLLALRLLQCIFLDD